jgi:hypothetical protein
VGVRRVAHRVLVGKPKGKRQQEDLGVEGRIIKIYVLELGWESMTGLIWLRMGTGDRLPGRLGRIWGIILIWFFKK